MISYVYMITVPCTLRMPRALGCERDPLQPQVSDVAGGNASKQCRATTCTRSPPALDLRIDAMMSAHRMQCECRDESSTWRLSDHRRRLSSKRVVRVKQATRTRESRHAWYRQRLGDRISRQACCEVEPVARGGGGGTRIRGQHGSNRAENVTLRDREGEPTR